MVQFRELRQSVGVNNTWGQMQVYKLSPRAMNAFVKAALITIAFIASAAPSAAQRAPEQRRDRQPAGRERAARNSEPFQLFSEPLTNLEEMEAKAGTVLVKDYTIIGSVSGFGGALTVTAYEFVDVQSGRKEYGVGVEIEESGRSSERADVEKIYVDYDEMDGLVKGIDYIIKIEKSATLENFEAQYKTKADLTVTTFNRATGMLRAAVSSGLFGRTRVGLTLGSLADFRKLIVDARTALDKIK